jgi:hypothetical protein
MASSRRPHHEEAINNLVFSLLNFCNPFTSKRKSCISIAFLDVTGSKVENTKMENSLLLASS